MTTKLYRALAVVSLAVTLGAFPHPAAAQEA